MRGTRAAPRGPEDAGDARALDRTYVGRGARRGAWKLTLEVYERCLADALRDAAIRIAADAKTVASGGSLPPVSVKPSARERSGMAKVGMAALGVALVEGTVVGYSALAARHPAGLGWTLVLLSPVAAGSGESTGVAARVTLVGGIAALGLYDALVLKSSRYSRGERFWRNVAGWHAAMAGAVLAAWIEGPKGAGAEAPKVAIGVAIGADRPALVLSGRF